MRLINKQSYCIYTYYYDEFSVLMLVHLFAFAANENPQRGIEWQKAKKTWKSTCTRADSRASYLQRHLESLYRRAPNSVSPFWNLTKVLARLVKILAVLTIPLYEAQHLLSGIAIPPSSSSCCTMQRLLYHPIRHRRD